MAIRWIYDNGYVAIGVEWNWEYTRLGKITVKPQIYRYDSQNTSDGTSFTETLDGDESYTVAWGSGGGTRLVDSWREMTYTRRASGYNATMRIQTESGFGTWYGGQFHTVGALDVESTLLIDALPPSPGTLTATRNGDTSVALRWTGGSGNIERVCVERSMDGGSWSEVAVLADRAATSWTDTTTAADHSYAYRVRYYDHLAYGPYTGEASVTMSPAAPSAISTAAITGSTNVAVTLTNASAVATGIEWQVSTDDGSTWSASTAVSGSPVTSFTATGISGTARIRVRNVNAVGESAWLVSEQVTTICPPAAPTLRMPTEGAYDMAQGPIAFSWLHNPLDGSAQTAYQLRYAVNGGSWTTLSGTTASSRTLALTGLSAGDSIAWQVRTKGADASYSPWATAQTFTLLTAPQVNITSPGASIEAMPITVRAIYTDMTGYACQSASVALQYGGRTVYPIAPKTEAVEITTEGGETILTATIDGSEFLPANGETYTVQMTAISGSGLQASANASFIVDFDPPVAGELTIANDPETGYVTIGASFGEPAQDEAAALTVSVSRVNADGTLTPLIVDAESGAAAVDMYAPLNTAYRYAVTTEASSHAVNTVYFDNLMEAPYWFAYWDGNIARARWNPNGSVSMTRPEKRRVYYAGREFPVSYDGSAVEQVAQVKWTFLEGEGENLEQLMRDGGRGVYKGADGHVFRADFEYSRSANYASVEKIGEVTMTMTRIDGEQL